MILSTQWISKFPTNPLLGQRVAVVGDGMVDRYIWGEVERISPEAPVPVVNVRQRTTQLGGAGNVARNLAHIGAIPLMLTRIGEDDGARAFRDLCAAEEIPLDYVVTSAVPTTFKTRVIARSQQVVRFDEEDTNIMTPALRAAIETQLKAMRALTDVVIVSDYGKGMIDQPMLELINKLWADGQVLVDPKPRSSITYRGVSGMTPNCTEARKLLDDETRIDSDAAAAAAAQRLVDTLNLDHILLTRSEQGMTLLARGSEAVHLPTLAIEVAEVSGAGDTVIAFFAAGIAAGLSLPDATQLANLAGGVVVGKVGTATATWAELQERMTELTADTAAA